MKIHSSAQMRAKKRKKPPFSSTFLQKSTLFRAFCAHFCKFLRLFTTFSSPKPKKPPFKPPKNHI
ncbi:hypothetical protein ACFL3G_05070, partial [Planctomycetota bacterium]